jgi:cadmium resistance protein CadD (predicted permease)
MLTFIVALLFACVIAFDLAPQVKQAGALHKDSAVYMAFVAVSLAVLLLYSFNIPLPSLSGPISGVIKALFRVK